MQAQLRMACGAQPAVGLSPAPPSDHEVAEKELERVGSVRMPLPTKPGPSASGQQLTLAVLPTGEEAVARGAEAPVAALCVPAGVLAQAPHPALVQVWPGHWWWWWWWRQRYRLSHRHPRGHSRAPCDRWPTPSPCPAPPDSGFGVSRSGAWRARGGGALSSPPQGLGGTTPSRAAIQAGTPKHVRPRGHRPWPLQPALTGPPGLCPPPRVNLEHTPPP